MGFTLAEVLITLVIIGVIAALTIPNLMQKYQDEALKTAFKKTYTTLNNAYKSILAETGPLDCYHDGQMKSVTQNADCDLLYNKLTSGALKIVKKCNHGLQDGCLPAGGYKNSKDALIDSGETEERATGLTESCPAARQIHNLRAITLSDGQIIIFWAVPRQLWVDINGKKGPNKWGYDLFSFNISEKRINTTIIEPSIAPDSTACIVKEKGGRTPWEMYKYSILNK